MPEPLATRAAPPTTAAVPGPHLGLTWRPLAADDAAALHALAQRCEAVDEPLMRTSPLDAEKILTRPAATADSLGGFDGAGQLRAAAFVHSPLGDETTARVFISASIDPTWRGRGVGRALLEWQDGRARQILATLDQALPGRIGAYIDEHLHDRRRLYAAAGFSPKRTFRQMRRPLSGGPEPVPAPVPEGIEIRGWDPEIDDAVRVAHNEAFQDHWGSQPVSEESWSSSLSDIEPGWSMVAVDTSSGEVAGYALTARHDYQWPALGHSEGFTELIGVRRPYRGGGLARALLGTVLVALHRDGVDVAGLDVDDANPSGAHRFYERMGYEAGGARILYTIEI
ncbi:GNAT family N-acetyltransferase [Georgenia sunbinii]|uniref:GNAT family N-acetyltransferase n=1 Tax=Georgenia sunbinii TaxID=3117728 RepID=UPI002F263C08